MRIRDRKLLQAVEKGRGPEALESLPPGRSVSRVVPDLPAPQPEGARPERRLGETVGIVVPDLGHPFFVELLRSMERAAAAAGYASLVVEAPQDAPDIVSRIERLTSHPVVGIISCVYSPAVLRLDIPVVTIGRQVAGRDAVGPDDAAGGAMVAEFMIASGHKRVGLISNPAPVGVPFRRGPLIEGLRGKVEIAWELMTPPTEIITSEALPVLARRDVTAIVCSTDLVAVNLLQALRRLGIDVPREVSVIGYDDISWAGIVTPQLTTVRQPFVALGQEAVRILSSRISYPQRKSYRMKLPVLLVERESTRALDS